MVSGPDLCPLEAHANLIIIRQYFDKTHNILSHVSSFLWSLKKKKKRKKHTPKSS